MYFPSPHHLSVLQVFHDDTQVLHLKITGAHLFQLSFSCAPSNRWCKWYVFRDVSCSSNMCSVEMSRPKCPCHQKVAMDIYVSCKAMPLTTKVFRDKSLSVWSRRIPEKGIHRIQTVKAHVVNTCQCCHPARVLNLLYVWPSNFHV